MVMCSLIIDVKRAFCSGTSGQLLRVVVLLPQVAYSKSMVEVSEAGRPNLQVRLIAHPVTICSLVIEPALILHHRQFSPMAVRSERMATSLLRGTNIIVTYQC